MKFDIYKKLKNSDELLSKNKLYHANEHKFQRTGTRTPDSLKLKEKKFKSFANSTNNIQLYIKELSTYKNDVNSSQIFNKGKISYSSVVGEIISPRDAKKSNKIPSFTIEQKEETKQIISRSKENSLKALNSDLINTKSNFQLSSLLKDNLKADLNKSSRTKINQLLTPRNKLSGIMQNDDYMDSLKTMLNREK